MKLLTAFLFAFALAAQTITVFGPVGVTAPGTSGMVKLQLVTPLGMTRPDALQFDIVGTPETGPITVVAGKGSTAVGKQIACNAAVPVRCIIWGMNLSPIADGEIADATVPILATATGATQSISLGNMIAVDINDVHLPISSIPGILTSFSLCDLNHDGKTDINDVQIVVSQAVAQAPGGVGGTPCTTGDLNRDGKCDVDDVYRIVLATLPNTLNNVVGAGVCKIGL